MSQSFGMPMLNKNYIDWNRVKQALKNKNSSMLILGKNRRINCKTNNKSKDSQLRTLISNKFRSIILPQLCSQTKKHLRSKKAQFILKSLLMTATSKVIRLNYRSIDLLLQMSLHHFLVFAILRNLKMVTILFTKYMVKIILANFRFWEDSKSFIF